jgi:molecular chaperone DnaJ
VADHYSVLGLERGASAEEIKRAYRRLAKQHHPDKNPGDKAAEERFKQVTQAYETLSDPGKRKHYDRFGQAGPGAAGIGDMFSEIFGDFFSRRPTHAPSVPDRRYTLAVDFRAALHGAERDLEVEVSDACARCHGTGARPGTAPQLCKACGGGGEIRVQQGVFSVAKCCTYCQGRGRVIPHPCESCAGEGQRARASTLKIRVPPGSEDGTVLRYAGKGEHKDGHSGDLLVELRVKAHPLFRRAGSDLHVEIPVRAVDAILGAQVEVPTLSGRVRMTIPPGTQDGDVFRLRGKGVPDRGDQQVTVRIEIPQHLDAGMRNAMEALAGLEDARHYPKWRRFYDALRTIVD